MMVLLPNIVPVTRNHGGGCLLDPSNDVCSSIMSLRLHVVVI